MMVMGAAKKAIDLRFHLLDESNIAMIYIDDYIYIAK